MKARIGLSLSGLALMLTACPSTCPPGDATCTVGCTRNADCFDGGGRCIHYVRAEYNNYFCAAPCEYNAAGRPNFACPDSPSSAACGNYCPPR